jgi:hypothetical protein
MWTTPQPSYARLPTHSPISASSSPRGTPGPNSRQASPELVKSKKVKGKRNDRHHHHRYQEHPTTSGAAAHHEPHPSPLPHEEDTVPSGYGIANEDYNTLTEEYVEASEHVGYDGRVKDVANEGPLVEGSLEWQRERERELEAEGERSPTFSPIGDEEEFRNVWGGDQHAGPEGRHL